ncbi:hypothetical protein [Pseudanabaena sp. FACHB-2040]|uniref:hypothetical protein n=1 Tax=Pseudanabaena sp. FACHB-2040 TaxID=2692859 RepID=UPI001682AD94|nr:hypothetical protein [Pseudanabaena sp. FACHB-2040]MBD2256609.1 hypothetical protein [Pseudanabaena sp. FACHB-2040]
MCEENKFELLQSIPLSPNQAMLRHILLGDYGAIVKTIQALAVFNYAEPKHWSQIIPTGRSGEYLSILTKREVAEADSEG